MEYDDALTQYINELLSSIRVLRAEVEQKESQLSEAHRQIAILETQLTHYYL